MSHQPSFPRLEVPPVGDLQSHPPAGIRAEEASSARTTWGALSSSVWFLPVFKLVGFCCVLTCIAWLGERSRETTVYGPELSGPTPPVGSSVPSAVPTPEGAPPPAAPAAPPLPCVPAGPARQPTPSALLADGRLVLNEATVADLDRLPGIGQKRAEDIVLVRTRLGGFKRLTDLLRIRGIGPRSLAGLKEHLVLDRPREEAAAASAPGAGSPASGPSKAASGATPTDPTESR